MTNPIQVIYAPGTFGNCVRWMFDRFTKGTNFKGIDSPWDKDHRAHGFDKDVDKVHVGFNQYVNVDTIQHFLYRDFPDERQEK